MKPSPSEFGKWCQSFGGTPLKSRGSVVCEKEGEKVEYFPRQEVILGPEDVYPIERAGIVDGELRVETPSGTRKAFDRLPEGKPSPMQR